MSRFPFIHQPDQLECRMYSKEKVFISDYEKIAKLIKQI